MTSKGRALHDKGVALDVLRGLRPYGKGNALDDLRGLRPYGVATQYAYPTKILFKVDKNRK